MISKLLISFSTLLAKNKNVILLKRHLRFCIGRFPESKSPDKEKNQLKTKQYLNESREDFKSNHEKMFFYARKCCSKHLSL